MPPDHIAECWSDELFALMVHHFAKRRERERKAIEAPGRKEQGRTFVSSEELIERMGNNVEVIGKDG